MKRIFFNRDGRIIKPYFPFWQPWGCRGCLWRSLVFFLGMLIIALLLSGLKCCHGNGDIMGNFDRDFNKLPEGGGFGSGPDPVKEQPYNPIGAIPPGISDDIPANGWNDNIPGINELPDPKDNYLPPVDSSKIVPSPGDGLQQIIADQIIVLFNSRSIKDDMTSFAKQFKAAYPSNKYTIIYYNPTAGTMLLQVPEDEVYDLLTEIPRKIRGIDYKLTTNPLIQMESKPSDPLFGYSEYDRYFKAIQAYDAWDITKGNKNVVVGIVDSYFCLDNPEINSRFIKPIHIPSKTTNVMPRTMPQPPFSNTDELVEFVNQCHGTHVASIAIGSHDNGNGTGGIAPLCQWIPISVGNSVPLIYVMEGILYAIYQGADVVNISMGMSFPAGIDKMLTQEEQAAFSQELFLHQEEVWEYIYKTACDHNCIICTASGNDNIIMGMDAAKRSKLVVKVEATNARGTAKADFSNYGTVPDVGMDISTVSAPGEDVVSAVAWGYSYEMSGTSQATPFVTGAIALMKSIDKNITPEQVIDILTKTGKPLPPKNNVGPLIQIRDALLMVEDGASDNMMEYEKVVEDHDNIIGRWMATEQLTLVNGMTNEFLDSVVTYMDFYSESSGMVEFQGQQTRKIWTAPLIVSWNDNKLKIEQQGAAICTTNSTDKIVHYDYLCEPDSQGLMEVTMLKDDEKHLVFNMRKIR